MNFDSAKYGQLVEGPDGAVHMVIARLDTVSEVHVVTIRESPSARAGEFFFLTRSYPGRWLDVDERGTQ